MELPSVIYFIGLLFFLIVYPTTFYISAILETSLRTSFLPSTCLLTLWMPCVFVWISLQWTGNGLFKTLSLVIFIMTFYGKQNISAMSTKFSIRSWFLYMKLSLDPDHLECHKKPWTILSGLEIGSKNNYLLILECGVVWLTPMFFPSLCQIN